MAITQNITAMPTPALSRTGMTDEEFITAADADVVARGNLVTELNTWTGQVNAIIEGAAGDIASGINGAIAKTTPVDADLMTLTDSAASFVLKKLTWANLKTTLGSTFAALAGSASQAFSVANGATTNQAVNYGQVFGTPRTIQKFTSGSGTYTKPAGCVSIKVRAIGGGGGGCSSGTSGAGVGSAGGNTTFGTSLLAANGAPSSAINYYGALGGTASIASPAIGFAIGGGSGASSSGQNAAVSNYVGGGIGGSSAFGGAGGGGLVVSGYDASANSGSGGGGGGITTTTANAPAGGGGGAGGYVEAIINYPSSTYSYSIGAGGAGAASGVGGTAGGYGANGIIIVEEFYV